MRTNLTHTILQLKSLNIQDIYNFDFLDKPSPESIKQSLDNLMALGAIDN